MRKKNWNSRPTKYLVWWETVIYLTRPSFQVIPSYSKMALKFNPDAPIFIPSTMNSAAFHPVKSKKQKNKPYKYRSKNGELWFPPKGWLKSYRCAACHEIMTRKDPPKCPQQITSCGHITCAKCIVTSYLVELNPHCPVEGCGKCVNPRQKEPTPALEILAAPTEQVEASMRCVTPEPPSVTPPPKVEETESEDDGCAFCHTYTGCDCNQEISYRCACSDWMCPGDCGTLWCGCIDVCRGRCGMRDDSFGWRW